MPGNSGYIDITAARLGGSSRMREVAEQVAAIADSGYAVYLQGEEGTGKRRLAALIHAMSSRNRFPFVAVACAGRDEGRLMEELFGRKGAMMGALAAADGGTLLLHGIDQAPMAVQTRLLHALEQGEFLPVGGAKPVSARVRCLAAGRHSLESAVASGALSAGLSQLLSDQVIRLPPLREIPEDLPALARKFLYEAADDLRCLVPELTAEAQALLSSFPWTGNIRELRAVMRRALVSAGSVIDASAIGAILIHPVEVKAPDVAPLNLADLERWALMQAIEQSGGRMMQAAALLGIDYKRFKRMRTRLGLL